MTKKTCNVMVCVMISEKRFHTFLPELKKLASVESEVFNLKFHLNIMSENPEVLGSEMIELSKLGSLDKVSIVATVRPFYAYEQVLNRFVRSNSLVNYTFTDKIDYMYMIDDDFEVTDIELFKSVLTEQVTMMENNPSIAAIKNSTHKSEPSYSPIGWPWVASGVIFRKPISDNFLIPSNLKDTKFYLDDVIVVTNVILHTEDPIAFSYNGDNGLLHNHRNGEGQMIALKTRQWFKCYLGVDPGEKCTSETFKIVADALNSQLTNK